MKNEPNGPPTHANINFHTLEVWTPLASIMKSWFWAQNPPEQHFVMGQIWIPQEAKPYSHDLLCEFLRSRGEMEIGLWINDCRGNSFTLRGGITMMMPVTMNDYGWIMGIEGSVSGKAGTDREVLAVPAKMPCYYNTQSGRGFCLIPEIIGYQLGASSYSYN